MTECFDCCGRPGLENAVVCMPGSVTSLSLFARGFLAFRLFHNMFSNLATDDLCDPDIQRPLSDL